MITRYDQVGLGGSAAGQDLIVVGIIEDHRGNDSRPRCRRQDFIARYEFVDGQPGRGNLSLKLLSHRMLASSRIKGGLVNNATRRSRPVVNSSRGAPPHNRPDATTLVFSTSRISRWGRLNADYATGPALPRLLQAT